MDRATTSPASKTATPRSPGFDSGLEQYDIIIVDHKMPHLSGVELVDEMRKRGVSSKIMVLSATFRRSARRLRTHGRPPHVPETVRRWPTPYRRRPACSLIGMRVLDRRRPA